MAQTGQASITGRNQILQQMTENALAEASGILSQIGQVETQLSVVSLGMMDIQKVAGFFDESEPEMISVSQCLCGNINGHAIFMINDDSSILLIRELINERAKLREMTEMEDEALTEVGNIIINCCISNYVEVIKGWTSCQLPMLNRGHYSQLLQDYSDEVKDDELFYIQFSIQMTRQTYNALILWTGLSWIGQESS